MYLKLRDLMERFAPHAWNSKTVNEKTIQKIEEELISLTKNPEDFREIQELFNSWQEHGSSSEQHFVQYFKHILKDSSRD